MLAWIAFSTCSRLRIARGPVKAVIRMVPDETLSSLTISSVPISWVFVAWIPPQSSLENVPMETIRTGSGYFSPNSIIAPSLRASARGTVFQEIGAANPIFSLESVSTVFNWSPSVILGWRSRIATSRDPLYYLVVARDRQEWIEASDEGRVLRVGPSNGFAAILIDQCFDRIASLIWPETSLP